jgi:hypothetical protein
MLLWGTYVTFTTNQNMFFALILMAINCMDGDPKSFAKYHSIISIILMLFVLLMYVTNNTTSFIILRGVQYRYNLGFSHPNAAGQLILSTFLNRVIYKNMKFKIIEYGIFLLIFILAGFLTDSRMAVYLSFFSLVSIFTIDKLKVNILNSKLFKYFAIALFPTCFIVNIFVTIWGIEFNNIYELDNLFSGRLIHAHWLYQNNSVSLFGNIINMLNTIPDSIRYLSSYSWTSQLIIDNSYLIILLASGIIGSLFFLISIPMMIQRAIKNDEKVFAYVACIYFIFGMTSGDMMRLVFNITLFYIFSEFIYTKETSRVYNTSYSHKRLLWR